MSASSPERLVFHEKTLGFGKAAGQMWSGVMGLLLVFLFLYNGPSHLPAAVVGALAFGAIALGAIAIGASHFYASARPGHVAFHENGIDVRRRGRDLTLPWRDIASLRVTGGEEDPAARRLRFRWLVATPAAHIADPAQDPRVRLWKRDRWEIFLLNALDDVDEQDILAAIASVAPARLHPARQ